MDGKTRRRHLGEAVWRELLKKFEGGDETVEAFCAREGVSRSTFNRWRSLGIATGAMRSRAVRNAAPMNAGFVDLGALRAASGQAGRVELTLDLGGGITLHVVRG